MKKGTQIFSWTLRILLAVGYLLASSGKLTSNPAVLEMFENWGYPKGFHLSIGIAELLLALGILIPKTLKWAILSSCILLTGAAITHLIHDPITELIRPAIFFVLAGMVYYLNFSKK
ncbi:MAG: DoxX family protein [Bacteroidia bacterium]|nr:DoxX family protein [Bacteroidia bacterium]